LALAIVASCGVLFFGAGCSSWWSALMGDGFHDEFSHPGGSIRPADPNADEGTGVSAKSQQIERDLGYR